MAKECEFCGVKFRESGPEITICKPCDKELERTQTLELQAKATKWGKTHKCRTCKGPLPLSRYFECFACVEEIPSSDDFDLFDDLDDERRGGDSVGKAIARAKARLETGPKACRVCKVSQPRDEYYLSKGYKDGRTSECKSCYRNRKGDKQRAYEERSRAKLEELRMKASA